MANFVDSSPKVAIVDYGLGNLFSVRRACEGAGLRSEITNSPAGILAADAVILPGAGAFGDAMARLRESNLVQTLKEFAASGRPFIGICLGMQLVMSESYEFGHHEGLGLVAGAVVRFEKPGDGRGGTLKVPHVGWNKIFPYPAANHHNPWDHSLLAGTAAGEFMYFVHSFYVRSQNDAVVLAASRYGNVEFCSALKQDNIQAFQYHPERSGPAGLKIYRNLAEIIRADRKKTVGLSLSQAAG